MSIASWPNRERPRERLLALGAGVLTDAELLALILRTGSRSVSAVDLARQLLEQFGGLAGLFAAPAVRLTGVKGLGAAKYAALQAGIELAHRSLAQQLESRPVLGSSRQVTDYVRLWLRDRPIEVFATLFLDSRNQLIRAEELARGTLGQTAVYPRELLRRALELNAAAVIICHNHPSGVAEPSAADQVLTRSLRQALAQVDINLLDHLIVAGNRCFSFAESGQIGL